MRYLTFAIAFAALTLSAQAQVPDPFEDYERQTRGATEPDPGDETTEPEEPREVAPNAIETQLTQGRFIIGGDLAFAYTSSVSDSLTSDEALSSHVVMLGLEPSFGAFVVDNIEVHLDLGYLLIVRPRETTGNSAENDGLVELGARYHHPIAEPLALHAGTSLGATFGSVSRTIEDPDTGALEELSGFTTGFIWSTDVGASYAVSPRVQLRLALLLRLLSSTERYDDFTEAPVVTGFHVGLSAGGYFAF